MKTNIKLIITTIFFSILTIVLVVAYVKKFWNGKISNDPAHWGQFGDYFGMVISLIGSVAVIILSCLVYMGQKDRDEWEKKILELNETPILIFTADKDNYDKCINVGKGSAHNVKIGKIAFNGNKNVIKAYSIPSNGYIKIDWANDPKELYAYYESIAGKKYLVKCVDDVNTQLIQEEKSIETTSLKSIVDWLDSSATRHPGLTLKMLGS